MYVLVNLLNFFYIKVFWHTRRP